MRCFRVCFFCLYMTGQAKTDVIGAGIGPQARVEPLSLWQGLKLLYPGCTLYQLGHQG